MIAVVIEDEKDHRDLVCAALEDAGWQVELAEDGIAGLGRIARVRPDVVLLDLRMPNLDGARTLEMLRERRGTRRVPVIVTTGAQVHPAVRDLADRVLVKPFSEGDLMRAVASCTAR